MRRAPSATSCRTRRVGRCRVDRHVPSRPSSVLLSVVLLCRGPRRATRSATAGSDTGEVMSEPRGRRSRRTNVRRSRASLLPTCPRTDPPAMPENSSQRPESQISMRSIAPTTVHSLSRWPRCAAPTGPRCVPACPGTSDEAPEKNMRLKLRAAWLVKGVLRMRSVKALNDSVRPPVDAVLLTAGEHDAGLETRPELGRQEQPPLVVETRGVGAEEVRDIRVHLAPPRRRSCAPFRTTVLHNAPPHTSFRAMFSGMSTQRSPPLTEMAMSRQGTKKNRPRGGGWCGGGAKWGENAVHASR